MIEIIPVGGFSEIGRNCVIVKYKEEAVILDLGLHMENYVRLTQDDDVPFELPLSTLIKEQAVPDLLSLKDELKQVKALCLSHAHLDHIGAVPFFLNKLKVPIHGTKFTIEVLKAIIKDKRKKSESKLISHPENCTFNISDNLKIQFINVTHSTPQTVLIVVHTPEGAVVYANDFKLDNAPLMGLKPNYKAMENLENVRLLIMDSLYALDPRKTPSESIAREMIRDVLLGVTSKDKNIVVTTFSSHIVRLKTIVEIAESLGRKPVFVGRSISKYLDAAKAAGIADFEKRAEFVRFGGKVDQYFTKLKKTTDKVFIVTGHQGEPKAILSRLAKSNLFPFGYEDLVLFCCKIIPHEENFQNRAELEAKLKQRKVRIFTDLHVSGHACREDHREFIKLIRPQEIVPTHGEIPMLESQKELAEELGYSSDKVHVLKNFSRLYLK
jgi:ribonuclease J